MEYYVGNVRISPERDATLSKHAVALLKDYYCRPTDKTIQHAFARAAVAYSCGDNALAQRIYDAASNGWFMFASPILSNAPEPGASSDSIKGLPISCFLCHVPNTLDGLIDHTSELRWLSVKGGGVGGHWSDVQSVSDKSPGPLPFLHTVDADMVAYRQGKTRKGSYAAYLDINHPDIMEFIGMRIATGGDFHRKNLNLHHGVNLSDAFMHAVSDNALWDLTDPHTKVVKEQVIARDLWQCILETRYRTGEPYLHFIDTSNRSLPSELKQRGLRIRGSNLCNEIFLPTSEDRTAVCCLSSLNLDLFDEWKDTTLVQDLTRFLDNVLESFIEHAPEQIAKARYSAMRERSIGIGAMGWHYYLQKNNISFDSDEAFDLNKSIFKHIQELAREESMVLAIERGEAPDMVGSGLRNAHCIAVAPNANSSIIVGTSPSIEPVRSNLYTHRTRSGSFLVKNKYLEAHLQKIGRNTDESWASIADNYGSVQHLPFLSAKTKRVYLTAIELDQHTIVRQAAERQVYICQGQSVNLFFPAEMEKSTLHSVHYLAWQLGCKGLYYLRTETANKAGRVRNTPPDALPDKTDTSTACSLNSDCTSCHG
jgi:ribonucleoside-diphosphate reductase alpha chain